jgi:hypothetical protein
VGLEVARGSEKTQRRRARFGTTFFWRHLDVAVSNPLLRRASSECSADATVAADVDATSVDMLALHNRWAAGRSDRDLCALLVSEFS